MTTAALETAPPQTMSAWPCGYCRVDSPTRYGDRCPCCGRSKPLPWWTMTVPAHIVDRACRDPRASAPRDPQKDEVVAELLAGLPHPNPDPAAAPAMTDNHRPGPRCSASCAGHQDSRPTQPLEERT